MNVIQDIIKLARKVESLKRVNRTGWALAGVDCVRQESVGEHSFGTTLNAILIAKAVVQQGVEVNLKRVVEIAALHDLPEALTSDIPRKATQLGGNAFRKAKDKAEREAIECISADSTSFRDWIEDIWKELGESNTIESRIVLGADIIDMLLHALSLETSGVSPRILNQFFISSEEPISNLKVKIIEEIFWELYKEHLSNADRQGLELERITR